MARPRILIIDDDPRLSGVLGIFLDLEGYEVRTAMDAESTFLQIGERRPDAIILDVMLPHVDGIEICRRIRARAELRDVPVIMFSARSDDAVIEAARLAGASRYISKPFTMDGVATVLRRELGPLEPEVGAENGAAAEAAPTKRQRPRSPRTGAPRRSRRKPTTEEGAAPPDDGAAPKRRRRKSG